MPISNAKEMLLDATAGRYAIGAFNCTNLFQMEAVVEAASNANMPVIIQTSVGPSKFIGRDVCVAIYRALAESAPVPVALHLDHCTDVDYCKQCVDAGYTNVMIDASAQPFEENVRQTKEVCDYAHSNGICSVEGELGTVGGVEDHLVVNADSVELCDPEKAVEFVEKTGVDILAPAIGTAHGIYKEANPAIDYDLLKTVFDLFNSKGAKVPVVVHGSTGLSPASVRRLVTNGGSKFNVSTELKHAWIDSTFNYIKQNPEEYEPGKLDKVAKQATGQVVSKWIDLLAGKQAEAA